MGVPGITEIATQDLFLIEHIPKFAGEIWFVDAGVSASGTGGDPHGCCVRDENCERIERS